MFFDCISQLLYRI